MKGKDSLLKKQKKKNQRVTMLSILAYVIIPIYTILFASVGSWTELNFSVIGNLQDGKIGFFIWGVIVIFYLAKSMRLIIPKMGNKKYMFYIKNVVLALLFCAVTTPFLPNVYPFRSFLHIIFAFLSAVMLIILFLILIKHVYAKNTQVANIFLIGVCIIAIISSALLIAIGIVSSVLEIFITITSCIIIQKMLNYDWV